VVDGPSDGLVVWWSNEWWSGGGGGGGRRYIQIPCRRSGLMVDACGNWSGLLTPVGFDFTGSIIWSMLWLG